MTVAIVLFSSATHHANYETTNTFPAGRPAVHPCLGVNLVHICMCLRKYVCVKAVTIGTPRFRPALLFGQVTVVNPPFLKLMQQFEPTGLVSTLSQEVFANIKVGRVDDKISLVV